MTPRRRMYGTGPDLRPAFETPPDYTGPTFSDDEIDESYGITSPPPPEPCSCYDAASMEWSPTPCQACKETA